jgi:hypothetical protein
VKHLASTLFTWQYLLMHVDHMGRDFVASESLAAAEISHVYRLDVHSANKYVLRGI